MADNSFDIVSKIDQMELDNAFNQCDRELATRFDFKNTGTKIEKNGTKVIIESDTEERAKAALDVFKDKLVKRSVSLKHLDAGDPKLSGKTFLINCDFKEGISTENAKKIAFLLMDMPVPVEPIMTHSKLDVNPEHHSIKKVKNNKYSEQIYADMGKTHITGDLTDSGDGISQSTE